MTQLVLLLSSASLVACGDDSSSTTSLALEFRASDGVNPVTCEEGFDVAGEGTGSFNVGVSDIRFYVSNLRAFDSSGTELSLELDENEFQYSGPSGWVGLIDLTSNSAGDCSPEAIAFAEGTGRTNTEITGIAGGEVDRITFDVGVPQAVMRETIADFTAEGAPSPLNEMHWSWASAHRHFVFNFTVETQGGETGDGYVHVGSRDCGGDGARALTDREACGLLYTPSVDLTGYDPAQVIDVNLARLLEGLDFVAPVYDPTTFEIIGEGPGVECHSAPATQPHCNLLFGALGVDPSGGLSDADLNEVFSLQ